MSNEPAVETGQFSLSGQTGQPLAGVVGSYEPGQPDLLKTNGRLYLVADGVGGATTDNLAGRYAIQKILNDFYSAKEPDLKKRLLEVLQRANADILQRNQQFPERRPVAAGLTAALIHDNKLLVANVGDGRVYVVWDQDIERLSQSEPESTGPAKAETASTSLPAPPRQRLADGLGLDRPAKIEIYSRRLFAGDNVVLCSGGLAGYVTEAEMAKTVSQAQPQPAARRLAELARKQGCRDNLSICVVRLLPQPQTGGSLPAKTGALAPLAQSQPPPPPDWEALARQPVYQGQTALVAATSARSNWTTLQPNQPRRRLLLASILGWTLLTVCVGLVGYAGWQYWFGSTPGPDSQPEAAVVTQAETVLPAPGQAELDSTPTPADVRLVSPIATPAVGGSTGDVMTSTFSSPLPGGQVTPQLAGSSASQPPPPTPTPLPTIVLPAGCASKGRFAGDVTVKDGQEFAPGAKFEKTWAVANAGDCPWGPGFTVRFLTGDRMEGDNQPVPEITEPGETGNFTVPLVAPAAAGTYRGAWQLHTPAGEPFGPELYVEIQVAPGAAPALPESDVTTLYDFIANAAEATWLAGNSTYRLNQTPINQNLVIPFPQGIVALGQAEFGGSYQPPGPVLLTHPHQELGSIRGSYVVDTPVQPGDILVATLGLPKAAIINDDGVTFEVIFKPADGAEQVIFSKLVKYEDTPVTVRQQLSGVQPGQKGVFILQANGGDSLSYDWAVWIEARLVRPAQP